MGKLGILDFGNFAYEGGIVNDRAPKGGGFSLEYSMANFKFARIRDIGLTPPVRRCIPGRPLCRFTREGCYLPPLFLTERHSFATAPQPHLRGVPITRAERKRQNHFNFSLSQRKGA